MKILIAGDYYPNHRIKDMLERGDYSYFQEIPALIQDHDFSIVNLETPIVSGAAKPIEKCGPNLKTCPKVIESLQYAGFNVVTLANNHIMDYGIDGLNETQNELDKAGISHVGTGDNLEEASKILYLKREDKTLAVINCCEYEFSIADSDTPGANPLNPVRQFHAIQEAKAKADYVLVIVHGGHEHWQLPSPRMVETYRFFVEVGADAVVNHHQHCFSGYEIYKGKPIFYGLGNFCFDRPDMPNFWYEGIMVSLNISDNISYKIHPYFQCKTKPLVHLLPSTAFDKQFSELNHIISNELLLSNETQKYYTSSMPFIQANLEPYNNRYLNKLYSLGFLPSFIKNKKLRSIQNYVLCEAHRDKMEFFFKHKKQ